MGEVFRRPVFVFFLGFFFCGIVFAVPHTFESGATISSTEMNANFADLEARVAAMESYFQNTVIYVVGAACPTGFSEYTSANGRFILADTSGDESTGGSEFISVAQMPSHSHSLGSAAMWQGTGTDVGSWQGGTSFRLNQHTTNATGSGSAYWKPYIQLKACKKD